MDLDFLVYGEFRVKMTYYLNKIVYNFPDTIQVIVATPEAEHIFTVMEDTDRKLLDEYFSTAFHHSVAQF